MLVSRLTLRILHRLAEVGTKEADSNVLSRATDMLNDVQANLDLLDASSAEARAATILSGLGFSQEMRDGRYSALSGGWRSRCSLATSLLVQSDILLLDECTNFLDLDATIWCVRASRLFHHPWLIHNKSIIS